MENSGRKADYTKRSRYFTGLQRKKAKTHADAGEFAGGVTGGVA